MPTDAGHRDGPLGDERLDGPGRDAEPPGDGLEVEERLVGAPVLGGRQGLADGVGDRVAEVVKRYDEREGVAGWGSGSHGWGG